MGSEGGKARREKLSPEQRKQIAKNAAAKRWSKKPAEVPPVAAPPPAAEPSPSPPPPKPKRKQAPKEFGKAYGVAQKRLEAALKERAEALQKLAALKEEIPSLVDIIRALGGQVNPQALQAPAGSLESVVIGDDATSTLVPLNNLPPIPLARGGAMEMPGEPQEDPDMYLKQAEKELAQQGWR